MKIIAKTTLRFTNPDAKPGDEKHFQTTPNPLPVEVPDWIQDDDLYALAVKGGDIIETVNTSAGGALTRNQQAAFLAGVSDADLWAEVQRRGGSPSARYQAWPDAPRGSDGWPEGSGQGPQRVPPAPPVEKTKLQLDAERIDAEAAESARKAAAKNAGGDPGAKAQELNAGGKDGPHTGAFGSTDAAKGAAEDKSGGAKAGPTGTAAGTATSQVPANKSGDDKTSKPQ